MKEQLLKDIKAGFNSLNEKLSEMLSLLDGEPMGTPITIRTSLTRKGAGRKMALFLKEFYVHNQEDIVIGLRLDGLPCRDRPADGNTITMAEFYDTRYSGLLMGYRLNILQDLAFWNKENIQEIGGIIINSYNGNIRIEYKE